MYNLQAATGISDLGSILWLNVLCLFIIYVVCYFSMWKGVQTSGKVVWFTALFPYVVLVVLAIRALFLEGSLKGLEYYLVPDFAILKDATVSLRSRLISSIEIELSILGLGRCSSPSVLLSRTRIWRTARLLKLQQLQ